MSTSFGSLCDDFYVNLILNTELELPHERDTVLHFFERFQKQYPTLNSFYQRETGEFCLDEDREAGSYRWITLEKNRICSGCVNPPSMDIVDEQNRFLLELAPYTLGVSHLDIDALDVLFGMDFEYQGNHDEILAEALFKDTPFATFLDLPHAKPLGFDPAILVSLSEDCRTQARISLESRTDAYQIRTGKFKEDDLISLYLSVRRYPDPAQVFNALQAYKEQRELCYELMSDRVVPYFVQPILGAIGQRQ